MIDPSEPAPPGWYDDPVNMSPQRHWSGTVWTAQTKSKPTKPRRFQI